MLVFTEFFLDILFTVFRDKIDVEKSEIYCAQSQQKQPLKSLLYLCNEHVRDAVILYRITQLYQQIQTTIQNLKEDFKSSEQQNNKLLDQIQRYEIQVQQKEDIINEQAEKISKLRVYIFEEQNQNETLMRMMRQIQSQLSVLKAQNKTLDQTIIFLQEKLTNPQKCEKEEKYQMQVNNLEELREIGEKQDKVFTQRTLKQKLQDANFRINRLAQQKRKLQASIEDLKMASQARINTLEQQIQQLQKRIYRDTMVKNLKLSGYKSQKYRSSFIEKSNLNGSKFLVGKNEIVIDLKVWDSINLTSYESSKAKATYKEYQQWKKKKSQQK